MAVTIAIPFYNAQDFLVDAVKSVFAQTYKDWELILIDDGSTDNSLEIANSINDPRVTVLSDGLNKRLAARLNEVTLFAKYDLILRMDADDMMMPNRIETLYNLMLNNDVDIVTSGVYSVRNNLQLVGVRGQNYKEVFFQDLLSRKVGITHAALLARKKWYLRNKYDESLSIAQDLDLWLRSSKNKDLKVISVSEPLYIYREENNITKQKLLKAYRNERTMIRKYEEVNFNKLILRSIFKSIIVMVLDMVGKLSILQKRRGTEIIDSAQINNYTEAIKMIRTVKVPGLNE